MNGYEFFIRIIEAIAWPVALLVLAFYLRKELPTFVAGVKRVKFAGLEAEFQNTLSSDSGEARESVSDKVLLERIPELLSIAEVSPKAAIPHAWAQVEYSLIRTLSKLQGFVDKTMGYNISKQIEILHENGYLSKVDTQLLHELRGLRNKVSHHPEDTNSITFATAKDYSEKCAYFIGVFDDLLKKNG